MKIEKLAEALKTVKAVGVQNILALRGDPPVGQENWTASIGGFECALDLVKYIRKEYGDYFGICVAGYPEGHPDVIGEGGKVSDESYANELAYLKSKIDAGGEVIVTQLFYDVDRFLKFVDDCRQIGIKCPILPGIMPIQSYNGFKKMTGFCKTQVPQEILDTLEKVKDDDAAVKAYGVELGTRMCRTLLDKGTPGVHMYSLNLEKTVVGILQNLGLIPAKASIERPLPWEAYPKKNESVRPIFWGNRPRSYLGRTIAWLDMPKSCWGDSGKREMGSYEHFGPRAYKGDRKELWGEVKSEQDVFNVFASFCKGETTQLPWSEKGKMAAESSSLTGRMVYVNTNGLLTINSQPSLNGVPSETAELGWGPAGGYVYQKAYLEFFCSVDKLKAIIKQLPGYPSITYMGTDASGTSKYGGLPSEGACGSVETPFAVSWGVFPGKEIVQPTVVDPKLFYGAWKDEAFALWSSEWACVYDAGSPSRAVVDKVSDVLLSSPVRIHVLASSSTAAAC
eukprot:scaffold2360_cov380-Prasinococcus_capsulatus_cf.AAC.4